jgi:hypothetical protein
MTIGGTGTGEELGRFRTLLLRSVTKERRSAWAGEAWKRVRSWEDTRRRSGVVNLRDESGGGAEARSGRFVGAGGGLLRETGIVSWATCLTVWRTCTDDWRAAGGGEMLIR